MRLLPSGVFTYTPNGMALFCGRLDAPRMNPLHEALPRQKEDEK